MTLFEDMKKIDLERNPVFTAIERLEDESDIKQFLLDYEEYLIKNTNNTIRGRERDVARDNIGYILGYYDDKIQKKWYCILSNVSHPIFGPSFGRSD